MSTPQNLRTRSYRHPTRSVLTGKLQNLACVVPVDRLWKRRNENPFGGGVVYVVAFDHCVKIGYTRKLRARICALEKETRQAAEILLVLDSPCRVRPYRLEGRIHKALAAFQFHGEWYRASPEFLAALPIAIYEVLIHEGAA